MSQKKQFLK